MVNESRKNIEEVESIELYNKRFACKLHVHRHAELFLLASGKYVVNDEGVKKELKKGDIIFFDSYSLHSFEGSSSLVTARLLKIPFTLLDEYHSIKKDRKLISNVVNDKNLCDELISMADKYLQGDYSEMVKNLTVRLMVSIVAERFCFTIEKDKDETELIRKFLIYLGIHFKEKISLNSMSKYFGYTEEHISRVFHKYMKCGIPEYINYLRYEYIENQIKHKKKSLNILVFESGFGSLQTYYRFKSKIKSGGTKIPGHMYK